MPSFAVLNGNYDYYFFKQTALVYSNDITGTLIKCTKSIGYLLLLAFAIYGVIVVPQILNYSHRKWYVDYDIEYYEHIAFSVVHSTFGIFILCVLLSAIHTCNIFNGFVNRNKKLIYFMITWILMCVILNLIITFTENTFKQIYIFDSNSNICKIV
eukprot:160287_1